MGVAEAELRNRALEGVRGDVDNLVRHMFPAAQAVVARALAARGIAGRSHGDLRSELQDLVQEVIATLFDRDASLLRAWRADDDQDLAAFVRDVGRRRLTLVFDLRERPKDLELPMEEIAEALGLPVQVSGNAEANLRHAWSHALEHVHEGQTSRGRLMLLLLFVEAHPPERVQRRLSMSLKEVQQWHARLERALREAIAPSDDWPALESIG